MFSRSFGATDRRCFLPRITESVPFRVTFKTGIFAPCFCVTGLIAETERLFGVHMAAPEQFRSYCSREFHNISREWFNAANNGGRIDQFLAGSKTRVQDPSWNNTGSRDYLFIYLFKYLRARALDCRKNNTQLHIVIIKN